MPTNGVSNAELEKTQLLEKMFNVIDVYYNQQG